MDEQEKVYVVPSPPSAPKVLHAVLRDGSTVASVEVTADVETAKTDVVFAVKMVRPKARVVYVNDPGHHPVLAGIRPGAENEITAGKESGTRPTMEDVEALRSEAYVCPTCALVQICKIHAAVEAAPAALAVVSACLMHAPNEGENRDGSEEE